MVDATKAKADKIELVDFKERFDLVMTDYYQVLEKDEGSVIADFSLAPVMLYFKAHAYYKRDKVPQSGSATAKSRREKEYTVLSIKDNGSGIDLTKNMNKLFQPFKRLTDQGTGSGLGLSIIKRVIERSQGYLEVFSQPGLGTEFKIYLKAQE